METAVAKPSDSPDRERRLRLQGGDLVFAAYNDTIAYAEILVIENGQVIRRFLRTSRIRARTPTPGRLPEEADKPFADWIEAMGWIEEDEERLVRSDRGWLWIHRFTWPE